MERFPRRLRGITADLAAIACLTAFAWWALGYLLVNDLFIFADNPGTYLRLWWLLDVAKGNLLGWNPYWYAGWPEWQFYPPGYGLAGMLLQALSLGRLSSVQIYEWLLFLSYLLPAVVAYFAMVWLGLGRWVGLAAGFFLLVFTDLYGGVGGVMIGMLGDRPALGLAPLAWVLGVKAAETRKPYLWLLLLILTVAAITLLHPFRLLLPAVLIPLTLLFLGPTRRRLIQGGIVLVAGVVVGLELAGFWLIPYLAHSSLATPVLRAPLDTLGFWLLGGRLPFFLVFAAWGLARALTAPQRERALLLSLALAPVLILLFMLFDWVVLVDRLGSASLDPIRFIEDVYLAILLLAAAGFVDLLRVIWSRIAPLGVGPRWKTAAGALAAALLVWLVVQPFPAWLQYYQPSPTGEPKFLTDARQKYHLDTLWQALRANPDGRVLFTSSVFRLRQTGGSAPSYLMALTPAMTGRETIGGTFQHWAPLATYYWEGDNAPAMMTERTDLKDDQTIFGLPWRQMDDAKLLQILKDLNVTDVVATEYDVWTRTYLDRSPAFQPVISDPQFNVYRVANYQPSLVDSSQATVQAQVVDGDVRLHVTSAQPNATALLKMTYYPLWQATSTAGPVKIEANPMGLTTLTLPAGADYDVDLHYQPGGAEQAGLAVTVVALVVLLVLGVVALTGLVRQGERSTETGAAAVRRAAG